ncbi:E3 ubiquitin-protein ligase SH3RF1-like isoform X2 [Lineus longissimus]|uniref:E3 ubiquitin-protein ligase SH3RF1-like isoform X2 n=1 Tax=Lineus longissimus TaxID=88925 RepID=UPI00315D0C36
MDEDALNELLECSVCLDRLDTTSKVLPCQHTFCKRCLDEIISTKSELRCPECRALVEIPVDELPSNILLMRLLEGIHQKSLGIGGSSNTSPMTVLAGLMASKPIGSLGTSGSSSTKSFQKIGGPARQPCAKAVYNYDGTDPGDLSFKKNDLINLQKQVDDNWLHGELNGQLGFFPASYVQILTPLPDNNPKCKALYNFQIDDKSEKGCLTFHKDEVLTVIRRVDDNWAEGRLGDKIGIFPIAFVEMNDAGKDLMSKLSLNIINADNRGSANQDQSSTDPGGGLGDSQTSSTGGGQNAPGGSGDAPLQATPPLFAHKRHSLTIPSSPTVAVQPNRYSAELISSFTAPPVPTPASATVMTSSPAVSVTSATTVPKAVSQSSQIPLNPPSVRGTAPTTPTTPSGHTLGPPPSTPPPPPPPLFVALYNYKPIKEDEIQLIKGDYYTVTEKCQDGWFKGACLKSGKIGVFPGNYVQLVRHKQNLLTTPVTPTTPSSGHHQPPPQRSPGSSHMPDNTRSHALSASTHTTMVLTRPAVSPSQSGLSASLDYQVNMGTRAPAILPRKAASRSATTPTTGPPPISQPPPIIPRNASSQGTNLHVELPARPQILPNEQRSKRRNSAPPERVSPRPACPLPAGVVESSSSRQQSPRSSGSPASDTVVPTRSVVYNRPLPATPTSSCSRHGAVTSHSMSAGTTNPPPNVVAGASYMIGSSKDKRDKKEKEKSSGFMKRFTGSGKSKVVKGKTPPPPPPPAKVFHQHASQLPSDGFSHSKSTALTAEEQRATVPPVVHRKSSSVDASATSSQSVPKKPKPLLKERYRCIVPYPPQTQAELELKVGDIIHVHKKREDGWYKGLLERNGAVGLFPGSFVEKH